MGYGENTSETHTRRRYRGQRCLNSSTGSIPQIVRHCVSAIRAAIRYCSSATRGRALLPPRGGIFHAFHVLGAKLFPTARCSRAVGTISPYVINSTPNRFSLRHTTRQARFIPSKVNVNAFGTGSLTSKQAPVSEMFRTRQAYIGLLSQTMSALLSTVLLGAPRSLPTGVCIGVLSIGSIRTDSHIRVGRQLCREECTMQPRIYNGWL